MGLNADFMPRCLLCRGAATTGKGLCMACYQSLPKSHHGCAICASQIPVGTRICGACLAQPPAFDRTIAAYSYLFPIDWLICWIKYAGQYIHTSTLADLCAERIRSQLALDDMPDCLVPVPLHPERMRERGFNQSLEFARALSQRFDMKMDWRCVEKIKMCQPQTGLSSRQRQQSPKGAFKLHHLPVAKHIAVVDDVMTTGATATAVAKVLRKSPNQRIDIWVAARTR